MNQELDLLDKVELRFGLAQNESDFESQLMGLLVPVLMKLESPHQQVRDKVMAICSHINKRYKSATTIKLPLNSLVDLYCGQTGNTVKSFALIYLELGFPRGSNDEARTLLPLLLKNISSKPASQQMILFGISLPLFGLFTDHLLTLDDPFGFKTNPKDLQFLLCKFQDVLLYSVPSSGREVNALNNAKNASLPPITPLDKIPIGLCKNAVNFITNKLKASWTMNTGEVKNLKIHLLKFILTDKLIGKDDGLEDKYILCIIACNDSAHEVQFIGDGGLKRMVKPNFENALFISRLYSLYQGVPPEFAGQDYWRAPANPGLKQKILESFLKSTLAANQVPHMIQVSLDALYGDLKLTRLRNAGMAFVQWIAKTSRDDVIRPNGLILLSGLIKLINEPISANTDVLRGFAYEAVGLLSKRVPEIFEPEHLIEFFRAISHENLNVRVSIQDALTCMIPAFKSRLSNPDFETKLREILLKNIDKAEHHARYCAVKYATTIYPFSNPFARYLCLLGASDQKLEIREEALKGLVFPGKDIISEEEAALPSISNMLLTIEELSKRSRHDVVKAPGTYWVGNLTSETFLFILLFLHQLLLKSVSPDFQSESLTAMIEEKLQWPSPQIRENLKEGLNLLEKDGILMDLLKCFELPLLSESGRIGLFFIDYLVGGKLKSISPFYLVELVSFGPPSIATYFKEKQNWIIPFIDSPKLDTKEYMSRLLAIVSTSGLSDPANLSSFRVLTEQLTIKLKSNNVDEKTGALLGLGYIIGKLKYRFNTTSLYVNQDTENFFLLHVLEAVMSSDKHDIILAGCLSFSEANRYRPLSESLVNSGTVVKDIVERLKILVKSSKEVRIQEAAIATLGSFSMTNQLFRKDIFDFILTLPNDLPKQPELHFNIGESLCACLFGFEATHLDEFLDIPEVDFTLEAIDRTSSENSIQAILKLVIPTQNAVTKKAGCIWLLCLTKYCGKINLLKSYLLKFHSAFSALLADKDEFTQEVASKGIGLIYDIGDQSLKNELVQSLVSTFTDGKKIAAQSVTNDTQLFSGDIGSTPDGGNLNSYQSILSLAADMNQPDLVYKFMSLASHHAIWNSRRGASMGFGSIAAQAEKELEPYLPKLVPRLYRYQFDPHPKTAQGMKNIWRSLVKDPVKSVNDFFEEIMKDNLKCMGDRQWRTREACCAALADLIHGRQLEQIQSFMSEIWNMCFRALDDIKESVRKAAFLTCKALTNLTVRYANPTYFHPSKSQKVMDDMVPFLLEKGLVNGAEEVRQFSLATILKLCKSGGILLKPHVSLIICSFLESLSSLEPQALNYIALNADKYNISQDVLNASRLSAAKTSPVMEALDHCVQYIDDFILKDLADKLCVIIRKGVGLPTKAGTARFIYTLVTRLPRETGVHADSILKALSGAIFDRSPVIRKSFSTATGYICRVATPGAIEKLAEHLKKSYLEANDEDARSIAPITFLEISRHGGSAALELHEIILPLAFMGSRDTTYPLLAEVWAKVWEENTGGSTNTIRKWKVELLGTLINVLSSSQSWELKKQVGKALVDFTKALGIEIESLAPTLLPVLIESLNGRTWAGKEALLEAFTTLIIEGAGYFAKFSGEERKKIEDILIREAKKNNKVFKRYSIECLGKGFQSLQSDRFEDIREYLIDLADDNQDQEDDDVDEAIQKPLLLAIRANSFKAIGLCFPNHVELQERYASQVCHFFASHLHGQVWNVRLAIMEGFQSFLKGLKVSMNQEGIDSIVSGLRDCLLDLKYRSVRDVAANSLKLLVEKMGVQKLGTHNVSIIQELSISERDDAIAHLLKDLITFI